MSPDPVPGRAAQPGGQPAPLHVPGPVDTRGMGGEPRRTDPPAPLLQRYGGRSLDPASAPRFRGEPLKPTVYAGGRLLVRTVPGADEVLQRLRDVATEHGLEVHVNERDQQMRRLARELGVRDDEPQPLVTRVELVRSPADDRPGGPPDAWAVLQEVRAAYPAGSAERGAVQLDHLVTSHDTTGNPYWHPAGTTGTPYWHPAGATGTPYWHPAGTGNPYLDVPSGLASYATPGFGGRAPVAWVGPEPRRTPDAELAPRRRPVVAVLDSGVGVHRWFPSDVVEQYPEVGGLPIGLTDPATAPEDAAVRRQPLVGELDATAGHGTFIAGLIRQKCPDATLLAVRVLQGDGVVAEADLLEALNLLWLRQRQAQQPGHAHLAVDVVTLSLGYYHESEDDVAFDPLLLAPIRALGRLGVVVVVSSGNDATMRPMYPAAFSPYPAGPVPRPLRDEVPVVAVGATNPDRSVALFSNEGPWVQAHRPGAALVSTLPPFDGARSPEVEQLTPGRTRRSTLDPDDFTSGFGVWSGTSFAAPILAGEIAQHLLVSDPPLERDADVDVPVAVQRGWQAVTARVPALVRPDPEDR
jgi:subtilisin family serine protease